MSEYHPDDHAHTDPIEIVKARGRRRRVHVWRPLRHQRLVVHFTESNPFPSTKATLSTSPAVLNSGSQVYILKLAQLAPPHANLSDGSFLTSPCRQTSLPLGNTRLHHPKSSGTELSQKLVQIGSFGSPDCFHRIPREIPRLLVPSVPKLDREVPTSIKVWCPVRHS